MQAQKILEGLAAQFKPIMKQWHLSVTNLVEHEYNTRGSFSYSAHASQG